VNSCNKMMRSFCYTVLIGTLLQEKKEPPKPRIVVAVPLGVTPGEPSAVALWGFLLDKAATVRLEKAPEGSEIVVKSKGAASGPKQPEELGNTVLHVELKLPVTAPEGTVEIVVSTEAGESPAHTIVVGAKEKRAAEREPNGAFATSQPIEPGRTVEGTIGQPLDVDVYRFDGRAGETWTFEVTAHRLGSLVDAILMLHDGRGRLLRVEDDGPSTRDATLRHKLPADGTYYLSLLDALNRGGPAFPYRLSVTK